MLTGDALVEFETLQRPGARPRIAAALETSHPVAIALAPVEATQRLAG